VKFDASRPVIAAKTLAAIDHALELDQGNKYRELLRKTISLAEDAYRQDDHPFRAHLGASLIGKDCPRELWYSFRWTEKVRHQGRLLRLFNRGHLEEARFIALLQLIGCEVWSQNINGTQFRILYHKDHFGGSCDCVARGIPDDPTTPILCEFKTHSDKSYNKVAKEGVRSAKFEHYVQMQMYMGGLKLTRALYLAVNKDNDAIYPELVDFDEEQFNKYLTRAEYVIFSVIPPKKVSESPGWFACKFCDFRNQCHANAAPNRNCRTCTSSVVESDGKWICSKHSKELDKQEQLAGCADYSVAPAFTNRTS